MWQVKRTLLLFLAISIAEAKPHLGSYSCNAKPPNVDVDWNKVEPLWYLAAHTPDEIFSRDVGCQIVDHFTSDGDKLEFHSKNYYRNTSLSPKEIVARAEADGKSTYIEHLGLSYDGSRFIVLTDYDSYLIFVFCLTNGSEHVLAYMATPNPSTDNLLKIYNALVESNGLTLLEKSDCSITDFEEEDIKKSK